MHEDEQLNCLVCSKSFTTNGELIEHLEEHKMTPSNQRQTTAGGKSIPDKDLIKRRRIEETASVKALEIGPEVVKPGMLFKSRPLDQGSGSYVIDNVSAQKERIAVAIGKHGSSLSTVEQDAAQSDETLNQVALRNSDHRLMDTDIRLSKPEVPEPIHHAFREIWVKLYECKICCTPFSDKESCESHYEAHLSKPPLPQVGPKVPQDVVAQQTHKAKQKRQINTLKKVAHNERHLKTSVSESQTDDVKPSPLSIESQTANVIPSSELHTEDSIPSSETLNCIIPKTEPQDVASHMPGRMYLCYVCFAEFTDQGACNVHIEQHTQTMQPTQNSTHPNHAIPGMSQHGIGPTASNIKDKDLSTSEFLSDAIHEISDNEDTDIKPEPEDSQSSGSTGEETSPNEITEPSVLVHEDNYIIPAPDITYQCQVCNKGYDNKSSCVKHVITHIKQQAENEGTSDAQNLDKLDTSMLPLEGRIVSVLLEKMTNFPEECEKGKPRNQYVVSFYQEGPGNSLDDQLPTLYQCQICKMKFKDRSTCQSHVKTHAPKSSKMLLETKGATTVAEDTVEPHHPALVLKDIVALPEQQKIDVETDVTVYQCHVCRKKFSDQVECESHIVCHLKPLGGDVKEDETGKQPSVAFKCSLCPYWFFTEATFRDHNLTHFGCKFCGQTNVSEEALSQHYNVMHPGYQDLSGWEAEAMEETTETEDHSEQLSDDSKEDPDYEVKRTRRRRFTLKRIRHKAVQPKFYKACEVCEKVFNKKVAYNIHVKSHNKQPLIECELCGEKFGNNHQLREHNHEVHVAKSPLVCELCGKVYRTRRPYELHMAQHNAPLKPCSVCAKTYDNDEELAKHMIGHGLNQPTKCVICGHSYKRNQANFIGHLKEHANQPEQCLVCKETFPTYKEYKIHAATHNSTKSVKCKDCGNSFATPRSLVEHIKQQHTKEHQFICEECGKGFLKKDKFLRHMQTHTGVKPYKCEYCDHTAGHKWDLLKHMGQHTGARPHMCHQCGKTYPARAYLTHHMRTSCKAGPRTTKAKPRVKKTIPTTPTEDGIYPCVICLDAFTQAGALTRHIKKWHPDQALAAEVQPSVVVQPAVDQPGKGESILEQKTLQSAT